jgi:hypothetical protein
MFPFYGRRFAEITMKSLGFAGQPPVTVDVWGINFSNNIRDPAIFTDTGHQEDLLATITFAVPAVGAGITKSITVTNRTYDYMAVRYRIFGISAFPSRNSFIIHAVTSDTV